LRASVIAELADDVGLTWDVQDMSPTSKINTKNIERTARGGICPFILFIVVALAFLSKRIYWPLMNKHESVLLAIRNSIDQDAPVREVRLGPYWTGVWSRSCGLALTLTSRSAGDLPVLEAGSLAGKNASELCSWLEGSQLLPRSIGLAALNSLIEVDRNRCASINAADILMAEGRGKRVALVGHFPFVPALREAVRMLWVLELEPGAGDLPAKTATEILPLADVVGITGSALLNGTIDELLSLCRKKSLVVVMGPSAPPSPVWFDFGVDVVATSMVTNPTAVLEALSQGAVLPQLRPRGVERITLRREDYRK
jgi:uncharacterized protein (DUF4213/DUF364 family)